MSLIRHPHWLLALAVALPALAQTGAKNGEWTSYGGDLGNTHYSPLDQVNCDNFYRLQVAASTDWTRQAGSQRLPRVDVLPHWCTVRYTVCGTCVDPTLTLI